MNKKNHKHIRPLPPLHDFIFKFALSCLMAFIAILAALFLGMLGYHFAEGMSWLDAFVNAAMILSGMGPVTPLKTDAGKFFAGCYALFSGLAFILILGIVLAPILHRFFHKIHLSFLDDD